MHFYTLEDKVALDNPVRFVDAFVDKTELQTKLPLLMLNICLIRLLPHSQKPVWPLWLFT
jgi:hypothetical protein